MAEHDPIQAIEYDLREGRAFALGHAGRRVESTLAALASAPADPERLDAAADAVWAYFIVRESAGFHDHREAIGLYRIPPYVIARVGIVRPRS